MTMVMMMLFNCCLGSTWIERKSKDVDAMGKNKQLEGTSSSFLRSLFPASPGQRVNPMALVKGLGFLLWFRKIPWRREWLPTPIFLPREFHGQRSLVGSKKKSDVTYWLNNNKKVLTRCKPRWYWPGLSMPWDSARVARPWGMDPREKIGGSQRTNMEVPPSPASPLVAGPSHWQTWTHGSGMRGMCPHTGCTTDSQMTSSRDGWPSHWSQWLSPGLFFWSPLREVKVSAGTCPGCDHGQVYLPRGAGWEAL